MLPNILPDIIRLSDFDPLLAGQSRDLIGTIGLSALPGLSGIALNLNSELSMKLNLGKDNEGCRYIKGQIHVEIEVQCQRCLGPLMLSIDASFALSPVIDDKIDVPMQYEPILVQEEKISLLALATEEILLNMPMIASHPEAVCPGKIWLEENQQRVNEQTHPFAILKKLK